MQHGTRDLIVRQRTQTINMLRAQLAEFGVILPQGVGHAIQFAKDYLDGEQPDLPEVAGNVIGLHLCSFTLDGEKHLGIAASRIIPWVKLHWRVEFARCI
jgi:hypothetical protein